MVLLNHDWSNWPVRMVFGIALSCINSFGR